MANGDNGPGFPSGSCPDSDHIAQERARLKSASQRHFAQTQGGKAQAAPPRQEQATGKREQTQGPADLEDEM